MMNQPLIKTYIRRCISTQSISWTRFKYNMKVTYVLALALLGVVVQSAVGGIADNDYYGYDEQD